MASHSSSTSPSSSTSTSVNPLTIRKTQQHGGSSGGSTQKGSAAIDDKRIYVGNLDPSLDEYMVLKLFSPFGKITKLDFMFHWHGAKKGTPRGYCFLEFEAASQAADAVKYMNRKSIKMRPLNVSLANMAPPTASDGEKGRKRTMDPNRPTAFSLLKAGGTLKNASTDEKIRAMERKLAQMSEPVKVPVPPAHASLPPKPSHKSNSNSSNNSNHNSHSNRGGPLRGTGSGVSLANRRKPY